MNVRRTIYLQRALSCWLGSLAFAFWAGPVLAQSLAALPTPLERSAGDVPGSAGHKYDGVGPGGDSKKPLPSAPQGGAYLVWTGFQMTPTGSEVFLQTTQQVSVEQGKAGKAALVIRLRDCRIHMANNRRKIDTRYFATPVSSVSAKQKGRDVEVHIALREAATVEPHNQAGPDGTQFLVLDFPPGKAEPEPSTLQALAAGADAEGEDAKPARAGKPAGSKAAKASP